MTRPAPLVPAEVDLDGFDGMMIDIPRLRKSRFDATDDDAAWRAGMNLWFEAWSSVPAGSLEDDDDALRRASGLGRDHATWERVRATVLRPWRACDDGRLYHPTVCETALVAWLERLAARRQAGAGNAARWGIEHGAEEALASIHRALDALEILNPKSDAAKKYRKRYGRDAASTVPQANDPNGQKNRPNGMRQGSQAEAEARSSKTELNPVHDGDVGKADPPRSKRHAFEAWRPRVAAIFDECPKIDQTSPGILNFAPLIALEAEGLDPDLDIVPAIIAVAKGWSGSRRIFSWRLDAFAEVAHGNKELRTTRKKDGQGTPRNGRGTSFSDAVARRKARMPSGDSAGSQEHRDGASPSSANAEACERGRRDALAELPEARDGRSSKAQP